MNVRWPDSKDADEQRFTLSSRARCPQPASRFPWSVLSASLATAEVVQKSLDDLNNEPPQIVFREELAVLLLYDGEPRLCQDRRQPVRAGDEHAVPWSARRATSRTSCPAARSGTRRKTPLGPWTSTSSPPADLVKMMPNPMAPTGLLPSTRPPKSSSLPSRPS